MTLETQGADDLGVFQSLRESDTPETSSEPVETPQTEVTTEPQPEPVSEAPKVETDDVQAELDRLKRIVAIDPTLRAAHLADKYGQPAPLFQQPSQPAPAQQQSPQPQRQEDPVIEYDPDDIPTMGQIAQLVGNMLQQQLQPFSEFVGQTQQQELQYQQQRAQQEQKERLQKMDLEIQGHLNEVVPGFGESFKPTASFEQKMLRNAAISAFSEAMEQYPQEYWGNPMVHKDVIKSLAPQLQTLAQKLGVSTPTTTVQPTTDKAAMAREMYVESGNAVPAPTAVNPFVKAVKAGDELGMFAALRQM